ncbi:MAG TPA: 5-formyltetrahydrofolate cyclo-ligase [Clostridiales bacterium]|nr:5-formyltetrahydrofolate cyclo-ligase [Clostridiales bacterium]
MKQREREKALQARRALSEQEREEKSARICAYLASLPEIGNAEIIFSYRALEDEVDLSIFHTWCKIHKKKLAFPVCTTERKMEAYLPNAEEAFAKGFFGVMEPVPEKSTLLTPEELDVAVVPMVAFDANRNRCGHGNSYYDNYLKNSGAYRIGVAFETQRQDTLTVEPQDIPMDLILTEQNIY